MNDKIERSMRMLTERQEAIQQRLEQCVANHKKEVELFIDEAPAMIGLVKESSEKILEFDANKRNNLIFHGIPEDSGETASVLEEKVLSRHLQAQINMSLDDIQVVELMAAQFGLKQRRKLKKVERLLIAPEVSTTRFLLYPTIFEFQPAGQFWLPFPHLPSAMMFGRKRIVSRVHPSTSRRT